MGSIQKITNEFPFFRDEMVSYGVEGCIACDHLESVVIEQATASLLILLPNSFMPAADAAGMLILQGWFLK